MLQEVSPTSDKRLTEETAGAEQKPAEQKPAEQKPAQLMKGRDLEKERQMWEKGRMHYAIGLQTAFFVTFVAFIPATVVAAKTGIWYMNVLYTEGYHNPFQTLVGAHAISGLLMLV